ncbi:MAG TPA: hypothetical protein VFI28_02230 [Candidatus Limnocylindrales bacterium]|nr:hypothetical protein [Candidatus Limnocylindrales bacterium]
MSEQRGDPAARAIAHDADAAPEAGRDPHAPVADPQAGRPPADPADGSAAHPVNDHEAHEAQPLGPIDTTAWAAGLVGVLLGLAVAICFVFATSGIG